MIVENGTPSLEQERKVVMIALETCYMLLPAIYTNVLKMFDYIAWSNLGKPFLVEISYLI